jgi:hypothetical protein
MWLNSKSKQTIKHEASDEVDMSVQKEVLPSSTWQNLIFLL